MELSTYGKVNLLGFKAITTKQLKLSTFFSVYSYNKISIGLANATPNNFFGNFASLILKQLQAHTCEYIVKFIVFNTHVS